MPLFESIIGHYLAQAIVYSLISITVVECMIALWHIHEPWAHIKFRFLTLSLPSVCPLLYSLLYPPRNSFSFREQVALIDINKWLGLPLGENIFTGHIFIAMLIITTVMFVMREAIPFMKHYLGHSSLLLIIERGQLSKLDTALGNLQLTKAFSSPTFLLSPDLKPIAYSSGSKTLVVSESLINLLETDELETLIGHEIAHLSRWATWINRVLLILRFVMFYNPITLPIFHGIMNDVEKLCDDIAVRLTGKPLSLTSGLLKLEQYLEANPSHSQSSKKQRTTSIATLKNVAHRKLVKERIKRIAYPGKSGDIPYQNFRAGVTGIMLAALLFFVV